MIFQNAELHNIEEVFPVEGENAHGLSRIPERLRCQLNASARQRAHSPAGAEIRFNLKSGEARVGLRVAETLVEKRAHLPMLAEIYRGDFLDSWCVINPEWTDLRIPAAPADTLPELASRQGPRRFDPALIRVLLPYYPMIHLRSIEGDIALPFAGQVPSRRYLAYGSSITQGILAVRPEESYPSKVAQSLGVDLINLGFGGGAHLEPAMAEYIANRSDWEFASLELGVNLRTLPVVDFRRRLENFLPRLVASRGDRWIFCTDLFTLDLDYAGNGQADAFREAVREIVARLSDPKLVYLSGRELLQRPTGLTTDLLHPGPNGFAEIGARIAAEVSKKIRTTSIEEKNDENEI